MNGVMAQLDRQPAYYANGTKRPEFPMQVWHAVPRVGDEIYFEHPVRIVGTVRSVIWFLPDSVRVVVAEDPRGLP